LFFLLYKVIPDVSCSHSVRCRSMKTEYYLNTFILRPQKHPAISVEKLIVWESFQIPMNCLWTILWGLIKTKGQQLQFVIMERVQRLQNWLVSLCLLDNEEQHGESTERMLLEKLHNGTVLCHLVNKLNPGVIEKVRGHCSEWKKAISIILK
jgi:hypothetical protein